MFCRKCGYQLDEGASFCVSCGCKLLAQGDQQESQMQQEVLADKPYLTIHEFIRSPYGSHLRKKYTMVRVLSWMGIFLTAAVYGTILLLFIMMALEKGGDLGSKFDTIFVPMGVATLLVMAFTGIILLARVPKKLTKGACVGAVIGGYFSVVALFPAIGMLLRVRKIDEEYKRFLYT